MSSLALLTLPEIETPETVPEAGMDSGISCLFCPQNPYIIGRGHTSHPPEARSHPGWWKWTQKQARENNQALLEKISSLEAEVRALKQQLYGRKSEQGKSGAVGPGLSPKEEDRPGRKDSNPNGEVPGGRSTRLFPMSP